MNLHHSSAGYIGDDKATAATLDSEGWLRTGDLCYIDKEGFLFFVDRIKELIKCKGYQVDTSVFAVELITITTAQEIQTSNDKSQWFFFVSLTRITLINSCMLHLQICDCIRLPQQNSSICSNRIQISLRQL